MASFDNQTLRERVYLHLRTEILGNGISPGTVLQEVPLAKSLGVTFEEIDIELDPEAAALVESVNGGNQTVPTVVFDDGSALTNPSIGQVKEHLARL